MSKKRISEEELTRLMERAQAGDERAFDRLLEPCLQLCMHYLRGRLWLPDEDEMLQEIRIAIWSAVRTWDSTRGGKARSHVLSAAERRISSILRAEGMAKRRINREAVSIHVYYDDGTEDTLGVSPDTSGEWLHRECRRITIQDFRERLSPTETLVYDAMIDEAGCGNFSHTQYYADIMHQTGLDRKSIDNAIQRIRNKARQHQIDTANDLNAD